VCGFAGFFFESTFRKRRYTKRHPPYLRRIGDAPYPKGTTKLFLKGLVPNPFLKTGVILKGGVSYVDLLIVEALEIAAK